MQAVEYGRNLEKTFITFVHMVGTFAKKKNESYRAGGYTGKPPPSVLCGPDGDQKRK